MALAAHTLDETVAVEDGVDGANRGDLAVAGEAANQDLADFAGAPMGLVASRGDDQAFDLGGQLVGVSDRVARAVGERDGPILLIALEQLVAGLAGDAELAADHGHRPPSRRRATKRKRSSMTELCLPCLRNETSPQNGQMPRASQDAKCAAS